MSVAGIGSYQALPNTLLAASPTALGSPLALPAGAVGVQGEQSITTRLANAARSALAALKGGTASESDVQKAMLAMQASTARTSLTGADLRQGRPVVGSARGHTRVASKAKPKKVVRAKTWKTLAHQTKPTPKAAHVQPAAQTVVQPQAQATPGTLALPGGMVMPATGAAGLAGLQGLPPQLQAQLGMTPTMWQGGIDPMTGAPVPATPNAGPQLNATNQSGLGQGAAGATQSVTNRNTFDSTTRSQGQSPWGLGAGGLGGLDAGWGVASPMAPYGSSMNGYSALGNDNRGLLSRLFG